MARANQRRVSAWCDSASRSRHPEMLKFATELLATWLPTEANALRRRQQSNNQGRGSSCKLCHANSETVAHALGHCTDWWCVAARTAAVQSAVLLLQKWGVARVPTGPTPKGYVPIAAWFDPSGSTPLEVYQGIPQAVLISIHDHDLIDGLVGVSPSQLDKLLQ